LSTHLESAQRSSVARFELRTIFVLLSRIGTERFGQAARKAAFFPYSQGFLFSCGYGNPRGQFFSTMGHSFHVLPQFSLLY